MQVGPRPLEITRNVRPGPLKSTVQAGQGRWMHYYFETGPLKSIMHVGPGPLKNTKHRGLIYYEAPITAQGLPEPSSLRGSTLGTRAAEQKDCNWACKLNDGCSLKSCVRPHLLAYATEIKSTHSWSWGGVPDAFDSIKNWCKTTSYIEAFNVVV